MSSLKDKVMTRFRRGPSEEEAVLQSLGRIEKLIGELKRERDELARQRGELVRV